MTGRAFAGAVSALVLGLLVAAVASSQATAAASAGTAPRAPRLLSETGLYADAATLRIDPANRPFSPQYPLWSDGAEKRRWIRLPRGTTIDVRDIDAWTFPVGTRLWKEFAFAGRKVETRMLWKVSAADWVFASYAWNEAQTDAALAPDAGLRNAAQIAPGKAHTIPSIDDCRACHDSSRTEVLGFTALQLSTDRDPNAIHGEPIEGTAVTLRTLVDERRLAPHRAELVTNPPRINATDPRARALLGYLSANCGACHRVPGPLANLGLNFRQPAYGPESAGATLGAVGRITKWDLPSHEPGTTHAIVAGEPGRSAVLYRMKSRRPSSQMPPLGSVVADVVAVEAMRAWIEGMSATR